MMLALNSALLNYLETLTGERHALIPVPTSSLPLFLRNRYEICSVDLFGRRHTLALDSASGESDEASPSDYANQINLLRDKVGEGVVLVLRSLPSYTRNRLVRMGVPFIVPGNQMFLPNSVVDLREHFPSQKLHRGKRLTPAAQCVVLYHLLKHPLDGLPLREIAKKVGYASIMLSKVKDELVAAGVCEACRDGRALTLCFKAQGRELWNRALPFLSSPVKKIHWVVCLNVESHFPPAGMTALSTRTHIGDDRIPTYAMPAKAFREALESGDFIGRPGPDGAAMKIESWSYDPTLISGRCEVDSLSLYLSLRDSPDERIQQQIETLLSETLPW